MVIIQDFLDPKRCKIRFPPFSIGRPCAGNGYSSDAVLGRSGDLVSRLAMGDN